MATNKPMQPPQPKIKAARMVRNKDTSAISRVRKPRTGMVKGKNKSV